MAGAAVVQSGTYGLFIDTGFLQDAFTLDDADGRRSKQHRVRVRRHNEFC
jgi:hypothetical protein